MTKSGLDWVIIGTNKQYAVQSIVAFLFLIIGCLICGDMIYRQAHFCNHITYCQGILIKIRHFDHQPHWYLSIYFLQSIWSATIRDSEVQLDASTLDLLPEPQNALDFPSEKIWDSTRQQKYAKKKWGGSKFHQE